MYIHQLGFLLTALVLLEESMVLSSTRWNDQYSSLKTLLSEIENKRILQKFKKGNPTIYASCQMEPSRKLKAGLPKIYGSVKLEQEDSGNLVMHINLTGFASGHEGTLHGFHVHEYGSVHDGCDATGAHFNPEGTNHGGPQDTPHQRHVGDFGNIEVDQSGKVDQRVTDYLAALHGSNSIIGRALVIHEGIDDLGWGGAPDSLTTGNAGGRLACCIIGVSKNK